LDLDNISKNNLDIKNLTQVTKPIYA